MAFFLLIFFREFLADAQMETKNTDILVVDDDADIRDLLTVIMELEGYQVTSLDCGRDVLSRVKSNPPDLILLDVMLGDADGRDICKDLKQCPQTKDIPIIIVSATHGIHTMYEKNCGANAYVPKPFEVDELVSTVHKYLS